MIILLPDNTSRRQYVQALWKDLENVSLWEEAEVHK
jgi:hypothetical protein